MVKKLVVAVIATYFVGSALAAEEYDSLCSNDTRRFTRPDSFHFRTFQLDSKGRILAEFGKFLRVTKDTKVAMGVFDKKSKKWTAGEAIEGGAKAAIFTEQGNTLRLRVTVGDDKKTITQILVTDPDWKVEHVPAEYHAIYKWHGAFTNGAGTIGLVRIELDDQGRVIEYLGEHTAQVVKETKIAMGKYNKKEKLWEAGADIPKGVYADLFKDPGVKNIYVWVTPRADGRGLAELLVTQVGDQGKKKGK